MTYLPKPWTLNRDLIESEYAIFDRTGEEQNLKVRLCIGLVALLYEMLCVLEGDPLPEVYPVNASNFSPHGKVCWTQERFLPF